MRSSLLTDVRARAVDAGLNLFGVVDAERFDASATKERRVRAIAPACGTVLVLGSGGRSLWQHFTRRNGGRAALPNGLDGYVFDVVRGIAAALESASIPCSVEISACGSRLPFTQLGEAAGFGTVSPVTGFLLHPEFGPWLRIRAALLLHGRPFGAIGDASISHHFQPCCGCDRPCVASCPAGVHDGYGGTELARCARHRDEGNCNDGCSSRSACPVGSEHRDADGEAAHRHSYALPALRRWFGVGFWRLVPPGWRGQP